MKVKVELNIEVPDGISFSELEEFFQFEFGYNGECDCDNPMFDEDYDVEEFYMEKL